MLESGSLPSAVMYKFGVSTSKTNDDVRDAVVADIVDEMETVTIETPAQEAAENEVEVNEETASPP